MKAKPLLLQQPVTAKGDMPSQDLVQVIQQLVATLREHEARIKALEP
ncbi:hypothetical protein [Paracoccus sp. DMF]|nr:hypothetical protein [Paracoccus sp. DMF]MCV2448887.1 hypothetical protein [Paracoccus sp. DMF]